MSSYYVQGSCCALLLTLGHVASSLPPECSPWAACPPGTPQVQSGHLSVASCIPSGRDTELGPPAPTLSKGLGAGQRSLVMPLSCLPANLPGSLPSSWSSLDDPPIGRGREGSRGRSYVCHIRRELGGHPFSAAGIRPVITCHTKHTSPAWTGLCPRMGRPVRTLPPHTTKRALGVSALRKRWTGGVSPDKSGEAETRGLGPPGSVSGPVAGPSEAAGISCQANEGAGSVQPSLAGNLGSNWDPALPPLEGGSA